MVNDAILKQSLAQVDAFLRVPRLADRHQPGHKLAARRQKEEKLSIKILQQQLFTMLNGIQML